jgi:hypothetical protein
MPAAPKTNTVPRLFALAAAVLVPLGAVLLYRFPPGENGWYPQCIFHRVTGMHCPGCGATRCLHALVHGDLAQAAAYNVLFLLFLPLLLVWGGCIWWSMLTGRPLPRVRLPRWSVHLLFALLLGFWIVRNLPFAPFTFLAPHTLGGG